MLAGEGYQDKRCRRWYSSGGRWNCEFHGRRTWSLRSEVAWVETLATPLQMRALWVLWWLASPKAEPAGLL